MYVGACVRGGSMAGLSCEPELTGEYWSFDMGNNMGLSDVCFEEFADTGHLYLH